MRFSVQREALLESLQLVSSVVERRQTLPVLANLLMVIDGESMRLTGTDQEVELTATVTGIEDSVPGEVTVPARKLSEIWRSLPDGARIRGELQGSRLNVTSGSFTSHLVTLPAADFPTVEMATAATRFTMPANSLSRLLDQCSFAMAQQDVRYFFNGMLIEVEGQEVRAVATNGQRLALSAVKVDSLSLKGLRQFIIPRKGVVELRRVLPVDDEPVALSFSGNHMRAETGKTRLTSKLIDGTYPDYRRAIPLAADKLVTGSRLEIREALSRTAILSNEMYRNVRLELAPGRMVIRANNPLQEEAEETVNIDYNGEPIEIGFNVGYLLDALNVLDGEVVTLRMSDASSPALLTGHEDDPSRFVVSPMML